MRNTVDLEFWRKFSKCIQDFKKSWKNEVFQTIAYCTSSRSCGAFGILCILLGKEVIAQFRF